MKVGLLRELKKSNSLEDFITTTFGWILKNNPDFGEFFLQEKILPKIQLSGMDIKNCEWHIQYNLNNNFPDMACISNSHAIIFEHKMECSLSENQIKKYRDDASNKFESSQVVLITKTKKQHAQDPDLALCWVNIYSYIEEWVNSSDTHNTYLFLEFLDLLKSEGIEAHPPISHKSIFLNKKSGDKPTDLEKSMASLIEYIHIVEDKPWEESIKSDFLLDTDRDNGNVYHKIWGRLGLSLLSDWNPNIFVGFLLDGKDHRTHPIDEARGPDFCLIIDIHKKFYDDIILNIHYKNFIKNVEKRIIELNNGWEFYDHLKDKKNKANKWHPIHIRKPMIDVFSDSTSIEEQAEEFYAAAKVILDIIKDEGSLDLLKNDLIALNK